jgi:hypothetical protein
MNVLIDSSKRFSPLQSVQNGSAAHTVSYSMCTTILSGRRWGVKGLCHGVDGLPPSSASRGVSITPRPLFTPGKDLVPILQEAGWAPGPVWTGMENLVPTGIRSWTVQPIASRYTDSATRPTPLSEPH